MLKDCALFIIYHWYIFVKYCSPLWMCVNICFKAVDVFLVSDCILLIVFICIFSFVWRDCWCAFTFGILESTVPKSFVGKPLLAELLPALIELKVSGKYTNTKSLKENTTIQKHKKIQKYKIHKSWGGKLLLPPLIEFKIKRKLTVSRKSEKIQSWYLLEANPRTIALNPS